MGNGIVPLSADDRDAIVEVVNEAAETYDETIPEDCYSQPYVTRGELAAEMETTEFYGHVKADSLPEDEKTDSLAGHVNADSLAGVVGFEERDDVVLIHRLYVRRDVQGRGIGTKLLEFALDRASADTVLVGTWKDADWAIEFYERNGFTDLGNDRELLRTYWDHSQRRNDASVVLRYED